MATDKSYPQSALRELPHWITQPYTRPLDSIPETKRKHDEKVMVFLASSYFSLPLLIEKYMYPQMFFFLIRFIVQGDLAPDQLKAVKLDMEAVRKERMERKKRRQEKVPTLFCCIILGAYCCSLKHPMIISFLTPYIKALYFPAIHTII